MTSKARFVVDIVSFVATLSRLNIVYYGGNTATPAEVYKRLLYYWETNYE